MMVIKSKRRKMSEKKVDGIRTPLVSRLIGVKRHVKDPIRYPKIQCGYEGLAQTMLATQSDAMIKELIKEMIKTVGK